MFKVNEDGSIYVTRGDSGLIPVTAKNQDGNQYTFAVGDIVRFSVCRKKNCGEGVLTKEVEVKVEKAEVQVYLESDETKIGKVISKPTDYWYNVELVSNGSTQTIIGYDDEDGAKIFRLFPKAERKE